MALSFTASSSQYVGMGTTSALRPTSVSLFAWYYYTGNTAIIAGNIFRDGSLNIWGYWLVMNAGNGLFYGAVGNGNVAYKSRYNTSQVINSGWRLIGFTYDGSNSTMTPYYNGTAELGTDSGQTPGNITYNTSNEFNISRFNNNSSYAYYNAVVGPTYVFDRVISAAEVAELASLTSLRSGIGYIPGGIGAWYMLGADGATASGSNSIVNRWGNTYGTPGGSPVFKETPLRTRRPCYG